MDLSVTVGMEQDPVLCLIRATMSTPHQMVAVPSAERGNLLLTDGTEPVLLLPEVEEVAFAPQGVDHLHAQTRLEVLFPLRIIRIRLRLDFGVAENRHPKSGEELHIAVFAMCTGCPAIKHPVPSIY